MATMFSTKYWNKARVKKLNCPTCGESKIPKEFRHSNRNERLHPICLLCRRQKPDVTRRYYAADIVWDKSYEFERRLNGLKTTLKAHFIKRGEREMEGKNVATTEKQSDDKAMRILKLPERIAAIIGKTFIVAGDDGTVSDDEAIERVRDLLEEYDAEIISRNKNKRLSRG